MPLLRKCSCCVHLKCGGKIIAYVHLVLPLVGCLLFVVFIADPVAYIFLRDAVTAFVESYLDFFPSKDLSPPRGNASDYDYSEGGSSHASKATNETLFYSEDYNESLYVHNHLGMPLGMFYFSMALSFTFCVISVIVAALFVHGLLKVKRFFLLPWIIEQVLYILFTLVSSGLCLVTLFKHPDIWALLFAILFFVAFAFKLYFWLIVVTLYRNFGLVNNACLNLNE